MILTHKREKIELDWIHKKHRILIRQRITPPANEYDLYVELNGDLLHIRSGKFLRPLIDLGLKTVDKFVAKTSSPNSIW